ncbi:hypothetical protein FISHEDRAFT_55640 [Fistulina hepatica ATCC 64428]|uniref:Uncharacterized protein n=1 Tax=Fistulina hepatica ATCC 64428 TaxID=1128425 RepID=A0A0D7AQC6_9AGAR|nr:hypothetical protein FISHEDRAFT_55640 [Fistulina hepatica ATCC 64428]
MSTRRPVTYGRRDRRRLPAPPPPATSSPRPLEDPTELLSHEDHSNLIQRSRSASNLSRPVLCPTSGAQTKKRSTSSNPTSSQASPHANILTYSGRCRAIISTDVPFNPSTSPPCRIDDPLKTLDHAEFSNRMLKRTRYASNIALSHSEMGTSEKQKFLIASDANTPAYIDSAQALQFQTPCPSVLAASVTFKLASSLPNDRISDALSPVPHPVRRTNSRNLKENPKNRRRAIRKSRRSLESPFARRPGSLNASPFKTATSVLQRSATACATSRTAAHVARPTQSMTNSPTRGKHFVSQPLNSVRRPYEPQLIRPNSLDLSSELNFDTLGPAVLDIEYGFGFSDLDIPQLFHRGDTGVDFNRPPSTMSIYGFDYCSDSDEEMGGNMFKDHCVQSTPFKKDRTASNSLGGLLFQNHGNRSLSPSSASDDTIPVHDSLSPHRVVQKSQSVPDFYNSRSVCSSRSWMSDSLVSPPTELGYADQLKDSLIDDEINVGEFVAAPGSVSDNEIDGVENGADSVTHLLEGLTLHLGVPKLSSAATIRTSSLDIDAKIQTNGVLEPAFPIASPRNPPAYKRTRSGTIRGPTETSFTRTRSGTIVGPERARSGTIVAPTRTRSGTIVANRPEPSAGERARKGSIIGIAPSAQQNESQSPPCTPERVPHMPNTSVEHGSHFDSDSDDELLLKSGDGVIGGITRLGRFGTVHEDAESEDDLAW